MLSKGTTVSLGKEEWPLLLTQAGATVSLQLSPVSEVNLLWLDLSLAGWQVLANPRVKN